MRECINKHEVADGSFQFCPVCGERLEEAKAETAQAPPQRVTQPAAQTQTSAKAPRRPWPLSVGWSIVVGVVSGGVGLLVLLAFHLWRAGNRRDSLLVAGGLTLLLIFVVIGATSGGGSTTAVSTPGATTAASTSITRTRSCSSYKGAKPKPQSCISKDGGPCSQYFRADRPADCLTAAQLRTRNAARRYTARVAARAAAKARAQELAAAKARDAAAAAANAWHQGYEQQDSNVYWKWVTSRNCQEFATNGCWHVAVITRDGCSSYVAVNANEYQGGSIVNALLDNQGYGIPAKTQRVFELDADANGVTANNVKIDCS